MLEFCFWVGAEESFNAQIDDHLFFLETLLISSIALNSQKKRTSDWIQFFCIRMPSNDFNNNVFFSSILPSYKIQQTIIMNRKIDMS